MIIAEKAFGERYALKMEPNGYNLLEKKGKDGWKNHSYYQDPAAAVGMIIRLRVIDENPDKEVSFSEFETLMQTMHDNVMGALQKPEKVTNGQDRNSEPSIEEDTTEETLPSETSFIQ